MVALAERKGLRCSRLFPSWPPLPQVAWQTVSWEDAYITSRRLWHMPLVLACLVLVKLDCSFPIPLRVEKY